MEASAAPRATKDLGPVPSAQKKFALPWQQKILHLPFFKFLKTLKKGAFMAKTNNLALQRAISTGSRPRRNPRVLPFDPQAHLRHFHFWGGHVTNFEKHIIGNFENFLPVKYHTKRLPIGNKFIRHREPPQIAYLWPQDNSSLQLIRNRQSDLGTIPHYS